MNAIELTGIVKTLGKTEVLRGLDCIVEKGRIVALLGASGSGKTTLLRAIAGFDTIDGGSIRVAGAVLAGKGVHLPPERRRIGYVPQEGALFPHLTLARNVGYGVSRHARAQGRVEEVLKLTGLADLADRFPHQLSGGQQQRGALARALAPSPDVVLLDEPFNALDRDLRQSIRADIIHTLRDLGVTAVLVTHDPDEAFEVADEVAAMVDGVIAQKSGPLEIYRRPVSPAVAKLTGQSYLLDGTVEGRRVRTCLGLVVAEGHEKFPGDSCIVSVRPEQISVGSACDGTPGQLLSISMRSGVWIASIEAAGRTFSVPLLRDREIGADGTVLLGIDGPVMVYPQK
ncbi:ABC transporter ATP-binding protein [Neorhizobium sp. NCHU2750]|uniref:ABC transporter ATP-binding protein n=1 Tax=Neorhizobium sp. NCHU2750 TaxID=1825976 RepID=UPI000E7094EF|nr:iron ABC transporter ATP-binding protein [Neorhizobium sp. NCHU2750]